MKNFIVLLLLLFVFNTSIYSQPEITSRLNKQLINSLKDNSFVKTLIILEDQLDILALDKQLYENKASLQERSKIVIESLQQKANSTQSDLLAILRSYSANEVKYINTFWIFNMMVIEAKAEVLLQLSDNKEISKMDIDGKIIADAAKKEKLVASKIPGSAEPGLRVINAHRLWQLGYTGAGRIVMNIDTGVDGNHPALGWRWRGNHVPDSLAWFDPVNGTTFPSDGDNHGTATMGVSCGLDSVTNDTIGVAFGAEWIASNSLWGSPHTSYTIAAFQWAIDPDGNPATTEDMPDVINCSWYDPAVGFCDQTYAMTFNAVEAAGIAIVFNAGGGGPSSSSIFQPANINTNEVNTWATGAVDGNTAGYPIYSPSGRGPSQCVTGISSLDIKPEACAPGNSIRTSVNNNGYHIYSGSSMATAHVTGAIALLKEAFPYLTGHEIKMALYNSALDLGVQGEDNIYGMGLIDVWAAYGYLSNFANPNLTLSTTFITDTLLTGSSSYVNFTICNNQTDTSYLNFNIEENPQVDWLEIAPANGTVPAMDSISVTVNIDASALPSGNYFTNLEITSNDTNNLLDSIGVLVTATSLVNLTSSDSLLVGTVAMGELDSTSFWLSNYTPFSLNYHLFLDAGKQSINIKNSEEQLQWNVQFSYPLSAGNTGVEFDGTYLYVTRAFSNLIYKYDTAGNFIEQFSIPGVTGLRDLAFDGTLMYGGSAGNIIYVMDFTNQMLIGTINSSSVPVRHIAYDEGNDAFWVGNWDTDIVLMHRNGTVLNTINAYSSGLRIYGSAYDGYSAGGPFLWVFDQGSGPGTPKYIRQIDLATGVLTGVMHDVTSDFPTATGLAGGLFVTNDFMQNTVTLGGLLLDNTSDILFGYEIRSNYHSWVEIFPTQGIIFPVDSHEIKVYWHGRDSVMTNEGFIHTYSNDPLNPVQTLVHLILNTIVSGIDDDFSIIPKENALHQNYPNPFNPTTTIKYDLIKSEFVNLSIYSVAGKKIRTLINRKESRGIKSVVWDGLNESGEQVATGVYIYRLEIVDASTGKASKFIQSRKMVFIK